MKAEGVRQRSHNIDKSKVQLSSAVASQMRSLVGDMQTLRQKCSVDRKQPGSSDNVAFHKSYQPQNVASLSSTRIENRLAPNPSASTYRNISSAYEQKREQSSSIDKVKAPVPISTSSKYLNFAQKHEPKESSYRRVNRSNILRDSFAHQVGSNTSRVLALARSSEFEPKPAITSSTGMYYNMLWHERSNRVHDMKEPQQNSGLGRYKSSRERLDYYRSRPEFERQAPNHSRDVPIGSSDKNGHEDKPNLVDKKLKSLLNDSVLLRAKAFLNSKSRDEIALHINNGVSVSPLNLRVSDKPGENPNEIAKLPPSTSRDYLNLASYKEPPKPFNEEQPLMRRIKLAKTIDKITYKAKANERIEKDILAMFSETHKQDGDLLTELVSKLIHYKSAYEGLKTKIGLPIGQFVAPSEKVKTEQSQEFKKVEVNKGVQKNNLMPLFNQVVHKKGKLQPDTLEGGLDKILEQEISENFLSGDLTAKHCNYRNEKKTSRSVNGEKTKLFFDLDNDAVSILADLENFTKD